MRLSINYDTRDDRMFPKHGMFHSLAVEIADPLIASQAVYERVNGWARFYHPIWGPFIFRLNLEGDLVVSRDPQGVPIYERYFTGGINTIRGFYLFSLGPKVNVLSAQDPSSALGQFNIGGNLQLIMNSEIEFPIFAAVQIKGVIFFDAGNAYNTETAKYCPSKLARLEHPRGVQPVPIVSDVHQLALLGRLRLPLELAHWSATLRVGHPAQSPAGRGSDRLRVHDWQFLLNT